MARKFDWSKSCSYEATQKAAFHREAGSRLRALARHLGLPKGSYDVRSNMGGIAVSGEVTLHHDAFYLQASQPAFSNADKGLLLRTCESRKDYTGGPNHLLALSLLDDIEVLARAVRRVQPSVSPDYEIDEDRNPAPRGM